MAASSSASNAGGNNTSSATSQGPSPPPPAPPAPAFTVPPLALRVAAVVAAVVFVWCVLPPTPPLLSPVFGPGMVLQRDTPVRLWGWSANAEGVEVIFAGQVLQPPAPVTWAAGRGRWEVTLPATAAGGGHRITISDTASGVHLLLDDVSFGDVIWCTGQSNMNGGNTPVAVAFNASAEILASAGYPWVRVFAVDDADSGRTAPLDWLVSPPRIPWSVASPNAVKRFSAACWFHGKGLADVLGPAVPLGLIESAVGGSSVQQWEPPSVVAACGDIKTWMQPTSSLWNSHVTPFTGVKVSGIVFYQGETNAMASPAQDAYYACALPFLASALRTLLDSPLALFVVVQLEAWAKFDAPYTNNQVATLREVQRALCDSVILNAAAVTAVDGGDPHSPTGSIHPRAKQLVGRRTSAAALTLYYRRPTPFAGPRYESAVAGGGPDGSLSATVLFAPPTPASPGNDGPLQLVVPSADGPYAYSSTCPPTVSQSECGGFFIRASNGVWYPANAALGPSRSVILMAFGDVPAGLAADGTASGWALWPITLLYSAAGLPAFPWNATFFQT